MLRHGDKKNQNLGSDHAGDERLLERQLRLYHSLNILTHVFKITMEDLKVVEGVCRKDAKVIEQCGIIGIPPEDMHKVYCDRESILVANTAPHSPRSGAIDETQYTIPKGN